MTETILISSIVVDRASRQRTSIDEAYISELANSISRYGLINPIVLDENDQLVAGECRLTACKSLGWTSIPITRIAELGAAETYAIELEENIKRADLPWKDECAAITRLHTMFCAEHADWSISATADALGVSTGYVTEHINVHKELVAGTELVTSADKFSVARNVTARINERRKASAADTISAQVASVFEEPEDADTTQPVAVETSAPDDTFVPLLNADFAEWRHLYSGPKFNFLHCDFPYGVKADKHHQGAAKIFRGYADDPDVYWALLGELAAAMDTIVADSAHLMFWYSMDYHEDTRRALESMGWKVNPFPLIWFKSDNTGILPDPARGPRRIYETAFLASRGDRKVVQPVGNAFAAPVVKTVHMSEKNRDMLRHFFRMFVDETTVMLDPTAGSANAVFVAEQMGAKSVLGLERDYEFFEAAKEKWTRQGTEPDIDL